MLGTAMNKEFKEKVLKPFEHGYYIEAFGQLDIFIDDVLFRLLDYQVHYDKLTYLLQKHGRLTGYSLSTILMELKIIEKELCSDIQKFKQKRNIITHNYLAEAELVLLSDTMKQSKKENRKELISPNNWNETYISELKKYLNIGINAHKKLINILSTFPQRKISNETIEQEVKDVYDRN
jgi:hypothetical protein